MLIKTFQELIHVEHETLWNMLLDRVQHPERYTPGITETRFLEKTDSVVVREITLHEKVIKERISIDTHGYQLRHELLDHPLFTGVIVAKVLRTARQSPVAPQCLEYDVELQRKSFLTQGIVQGEEELVADIQIEMHRLKVAAERLERAASAGSNPAAPGGGR